MKVVRLSALRTERLYPPGYIPGTHFCCWTVRDRIPVETRFSARPDRPWGPPSFLYNWYRVFPGGKVRPGRPADHSPPSSAAVLEEYGYNSTHPLGHTGSVTGSLYLLPNETWLISFHFSVTDIIKFICEMQTTLQCNCLAHKKNFQSL